MKKVCYVFMISLTLINFWGCTKKSIQPIGGKAKTEVYFSYLNDDYKVVENKTNNLWMRIKDISENLSLISSKTNEDEYTAILTDEKNNITVAMVYKDGKNFPDYITFAKDNQIVRGTASDYVNGAFDVLWELDGSQEVFYNIKLTNDIDYYNNISGLDKTENYQAKTIITSLKIWDAINNYVQDPNNRPSARFFFIFGFIAAISISTAVMIGITVAALAVGIIAAAVTIAVLSNPTPPPAEVIPKGDTIDTFPSVAKFYIQYKGVDVKYGEVFTIDYNGARMTIAAPEEPKNEYIENYHSRLTLNPIHIGNDKVGETNKYNINVSLEGNHGDPNSLIDAYYRFFLNKEKGSSLTDNKSGNLYKSVSLPSQKSNFMILDIDKKNRYDNTNNLNLNFVFENPIEIYGRLTNNFLIKVN